MLAFAFLLFVGSQLSLSAQAYEAPPVKFEYSYGLDMFCPERITPENLSAQQLKLISKIPVYRRQLLDQLPEFQNQWNNQGHFLLRQALQLVEKPFPAASVQAALFLCPRFPSMATPLALNVISYLELSAQDIDGLNGKPLPIFFFVSTAFHEVLHKYIDSILEDRPSLVLANSQETELYKAHLHLFALQKKVYDSLNLSYFLLEIKKLETLHGPDYERAWADVHNSSRLADQLFQELKASQ